MLFVSSDDKNIDNEEMSLLIGNFGRKCYSKKKKRKKLLLLEMKILPVVSAQCFSKYRKEECLVFSSHNRRHVIQNVSKPSQYHIKKKVILSMSSSLSVFYNREQDMEKAVFDFISERKRMAA